MSLIEQLGGYAKLKPHFITTDAELGYTHVYLHGNSHYCFLDDSIDYIIPERAILIKDVINALLEYRRQHNIFEVGDKVVGIDKYSNDMIFTVAELTSKNVFTSMEFGEIAYSFVRHAKAEEIKAGKRLEVNQ